MKNLITVITAYPENLSFENTVRCHETDHSETHAFSDEFFFDLVEDLKKPVLATPVKVECRVFYPNGKEVLFTIERAEV